MMSKVPFVLAVILVSVSCKDPAERPPEDGWAVGLLLPFTGSEAAVGTGYERAAWMAKDAINSAGGIGGHPIYFVTDDTHSKPKRAVDSLNDILEHDIVALIGPEGSEIARKVLPRLEKRDILFVSPMVSGAADIEVTESNPWIRLAPSSSILGRAFANHLYRDKEIETLSTVCSEEDYNTDFVAALEDQFEALGGVVESSIELESGQLSYNDEVNLLRLGDTRNLVLSSSTKTAARFVNDMTLTDSAAKWQWLLSPVLETPVFVENTMTDALEGAVGIGIDVEERPDDFIGYFEDEWKDVPGDGAYYYFDALMVLALSMQGALEEDRGKLKYDTLVESVRSVAAPTGIQVRWDEIGDGMKYLRDGRDVYYTGLTGTLFLNQYGQQQKAPMKTWSIIKGEIVTNDEQL